MNFEFGENLFDRFLDNFDMENVEYSKWVPVGALVKGLFLWLVRLLLLLSWFSFSMMDY
jgi:hypothetical protein